MPSRGRDGPRRFAAETKVPVERSRAELEQLLKQHKATEFGLLTTAARHIVQFRVNERLVRLVVEYPAPASFQRYKVVLGVKKPQLTQDQLNKAAEAEWRRRWRALLLLTKARLELVASGQTTMDREFLPDVMMPDGRLLHEVIEPLMRRAYLDGAMPPALLLGAGNET